MTRKTLIKLAASIPATGLVLGAVLLASHGVAHPATTAACKSTSYQTGEPIVLEEADATASTNDTTLRTQYAQALSGIAASASSNGAYLIVDTFGSTVGNIRVLCSVSTQQTGAAPLIALAQQTALRHALAEISRQASQTNMGASGSSIYGALVDGIQRVQLLRAGQHVPADVVVITDGDESDRGGVHLRHLLGTGMTDQAIAKRIIGKLPPPDAYGLSIQIEAVGHTGSAPPISTQGVRRMERIWALVCNATHARHCLVTSDILNNLEG